MEILLTYNCYNYRFVTKIYTYGFLTYCITQSSLRNHSVNSLNFRRVRRQAYNYNLRLFGTLAVYLHGNHKLEGETQKFPSSPQ